MGKGTGTLHVAGARKCRGNIEVDEFGTLAVISPGIHPGV